MNTKQAFCLNVLKTYSIAVSFDGEPSRSTVPRSIAGETFGRWKKRVMRDVTNLEVLALTKPPPQVRMQTLANHASSLRQQMLAIKREGKTLTQNTVRREVAKTEERLAKMPKSVLTDMLAEEKWELEPSVVEFFARFNESVRQDIAVEDLLRQLIKAFNDTARIARRLP